MSEIEFLLHLRSLGVKLWLEGDAVKFSAPRGALTPDLKDELKARKEELRRIYLLDELGAPVPIGVRGELFIGGVQVARGYLNRPELTADRFVPDRFVAGEGYPLYRTGDFEDAGLSQEALDMLVGVVDDDDPS